MKRCGEPEQVEPFGLFAIVQVIYFEFKKWWVVAVIIIVMKAIILRY